MLARVILLSLIGAIAALSQPYVDTCTAKRIGQDVVVVTCNGNDAGNTEYRLAWGTTNSATALDKWNNWAPSVGGSGTRRMVASGFKENTTYYFQPQVCRQSVANCRTTTNWEKDWDGNSDSGIDNSEEAAFGSDSFTVEAGTGLWSFTFPDVPDPFALPVEPTLSIIDDIPNWTSNGVLWTVNASDTFTQLQSAYDSCRGHATDGANEYDDIQVHWRFDAEGAFIRRFGSGSTNPDVCRFVSSRFGTRWAVPAGYITDPILAMNSGPKLRMNTYVSDGFFTQSHGVGAIFETVNYLAPTPGGGVETEGAWITSIAVQDATTIRVTTDAAHGISNGGNPNFVIVQSALKNSGCAGGAAECFLDDLNDTFSYNVIDTTTIDLTVADSSVFGNYVTDSAWLYQEQDTFELFMYSDSGGPLLGASHVNFQIEPPWKQYTFVRAAENGETFVHDSYVPWMGAKFGYVPAGTGTPDCGAIFGACASGLNVSSFALAEDTDEFDVDNLKVIGTGLATIFSDVFLGKSNNLRIRRMNVFAPDYHYQYTDDKSAGLGNVASVANRHICIELKQGDNILIDGIYCGGGRDGVANDLTENVMVYLRAALNDNDDSRDHTLRNLWINAPHAVMIEGCHPNQNPSAWGCGTPTTIDNLMHQEPRFAQETGSDSNFDTAGTLLQVMYNTHVSLTKFTQYISAPIGGLTGNSLGPLVCFWCQGNLKAEDGIAFAFRNEHNTGKLFWDPSGPGDTDQNPDPENQSTGGAVWEAGLKPIANDSTFARMLWVGWGETSSKATTTSSDADTVVESEMAGQDHADWTDQVHIGMAGETLDDRLTELALDSEYRRTGSTPGTGTEGIDVDQMHNAIGVLSPCSGRDSIVWPSSSAPANLTLCTHVPSGSSRECMAKLWSPERSTVNDPTNGLTFTASGNTITRADGGSFIEDGFFVTDDGHTALIEVWGTTSNDGQYTISNVTASTLTVTSGITDESSVTAAFVQSEPRQRTASGNGADVSLSFTGLPTAFKQYLWEVNCENVPDSWIRDISGRL